MSDLKGKTVIATGGASGIGEVTALLFAENRRNVVVSDLQKDKGNNLVEKIIILNFK
jgi:NAD(P)-dependent dehydrogenase (short-subunit alcohol dehydrogenase family)